MVLYTVSLPDVTRALEALRAARFTRSPGVELHLEYPVAGSWSDGQLLTGYIDLVGVQDGRVDIIDFRTDTPPAGAVEQTYSNYVAQVRIYGKLLETASVLKDRRLRYGLPFTAEESIRWIEP